MYACFVIISIDVAISQLNVVVAIAFIMPVLPSLHSN